MTLWLASVLLISLIGGSLYLITKMVGFTYEPSSPIGIESQQVRTASLVDERRQISTVDKALGIKCLQTCFGFLISTVLLVAGLLVSLLEVQAKVALSGEREEISGGGKLAFQTSSFGAILVLASAIAAIATVYRPINYELQSPLGLHLETMGTRVGIAEPDPGNPLSVTDD